MLSVHMPHRLDHLLEEVQFRVVTGAHLNGEGDSQVKFIYSTLKTTTDDQRAAHLR